MVRASRVLVLLAVVSVAAAACSASAKPSPAGSSASPKAGQQIVLPQVRVRLRQPPNRNRSASPSSPLPPVSTDAAGSCSKTVKSDRAPAAPTPAWAAVRRCFSPSGNAVSAGASPSPVLREAPDPASVYAGHQLIIVKTDGTTFPNGSAWNCITCGIPRGTRSARSDAMDYPQPFADGKRVLVGTNIVDCSPHLLDHLGLHAVRHPHLPIRVSTRPSDGSEQGRFHPRAALEPRPGPPRLQRHQVRQGRSRPIRLPGALELRSGTQDRATFGAALRPHQGHSAR